MMPCNRRKLLTVGAAATVLAMLPGSARAQPAAGLTLFDSHAHLVSDDLAAYPRVPPSTPSPFGGSMPPGVAGVPGGHFPSAPRAEPDTKRVLDWMEAQHVVGLAAVQKRGTYGTDNSYILDSAQAHRGLLVPVAVLDADDAKTPGLLRDWARTRGLVAVRFTGAPDAQGAVPWLDSPAALKSWDAARDYGLVVDIMVADPQRAEMAIPTLHRLAAHYPTVRVVIDHAGFPDGTAPGFGITPARAALAWQKNIYYKVTTINFDMAREAGVSIPQFVKRLVDVYGADHVMWGSDLGNSGGAYPELVARAVAATSALTAKERAAVLRETGRAVFRNKAG